MFECVGWLDLRAILIWKSDADILGHEEKVRERRETVRCQRPWPAGASRAREMVRKKSAHARYRGWDRVGAKQMLKLSGERRTFRSANCRRRARRVSTCDHQHCHRAAAVSGLCAGSIIPDRVGRSRRGHEPPRLSRGRPFVERPTSLCLVKKGMSP